MTHASQLSPSSSDYFTHKPRSFLSHHTDYDLKLSLPSSTSPSPNPHNPNELYTPSRGRRPSRAIAYTQPSPSLPSSTVGGEGGGGGGVGRPRAPLRGTMLRLLFFCALLVFAGLGWRCESVGCRGRGGGGSVVAGWGAPEVPEVVKEWGSAEGVDLSAYWGAPTSSGLSEGDGEGGEGKEEGMGEEEEEEGELVGFKGVDMQTGEVVWDDDEAVFGIGEVSGGPGEGAEVVAQQVQGLAKAEGTARDENVDGDDEAAEGGSALGAANGGVATGMDGGEEGAEFVSAQHAGEQDMALQDGASSLEQKKSWLGSLGGLF